VGGNQKQVEPNISGKLELDRGKDESWVAEGECWRGKKN
jgi:hypothetical protein